MFKQRSSISIIKKTRINSVAIGFEPIGRLLDKHPLHYYTIFFIGFKGFSLCKITN